MEPIVIARRPATPAPRAPFQELRSLWFQISGTLCNLACRHCFNASGPRDPWLGVLAADIVRRYLREAALAVAPVTVLTNGTLIDDALADRLARISGSARYSLEIRVSLDAPTADENDAIRGRGSFASALGAIRRLAARGLPPIVTATEIVAPSPGRSLYER